MYGTNELGGPNYADWQKQILPPCVPTFPRSLDWDTQSSSDPPLGSKGTRRLISVSTGTQRWNKANGSVWYHPVTPQNTWHLSTLAKLTLALSRRNARKGSQRTRAGICLTNEWLWHSATQHLYTHGCRKMRLQLKMSDVLRIESWLHLGTKWFSRHFINKFLKNLIRACESWLLNELQIVEKTCDWSKKHLKCKQRV